MRLLLALLMLLAPMAAAQPRTVLSGAHDGYSRLVMPIAPGQTWRAGRTDGGYELDIPGSARFDLGRVFERIGRNRIADIRQAGDQLFIDLACTCHLVLSTDGPGWLVADVRDGPAPPGHPYERALAPEQVPVATRADRLPLLSNPAPWVRPLPPEVEADETEMAIPPPDPEVMQNPQPALLVAAATADEPTTQDRNQPDPGSEPIPETEALTLSLADAVAQGFLTPTMPLPHQMPVPEGAEEPVDPLPEAPIPPLATALPLPAGLPGLTSRTSADRDAALVSAPDMPDRCLPDTALAVQDWAESDDFAAEIGRRRAALTSERDMIVDRGPELLAQAYLYFGFGAEARAALDLTQGRSAERDVLRALAHIVDGLPPPTAVLDNQAGCIGAVALWSALAGDDISPLTPAERDAAMLALRALPAGLAAQLGPRLARLHLTSGDSAAARDVLDMAPAAAAADTGFALLEADLEFAESGPDAAIAALNRIADGDIRMTPTALLRLIDLTLDAGDIPTAAQVDLLAAMRFERRGSDLEPALLAAEFRAQLARDNFGQARALMDDAPAPEAAAMAQDLVLAAVDRMTDSDFLIFAFGAMPEDPGPDGGNAAAARLIDLGFADHAADILAPPVIGAAMAERRLLRAAADVALGDGAAALATLEGMTGPRTADLRAAAWRLVGDEGAALAALGADGRTNADPAAFWRAGDFTALARADDPLLEDAARAVNAPAGLPDDAPPLAARAALLAEAETTRALAAALLDRFPLPPEPE